MALCFKPVCRVAYQQIKDIHLLQFHFSNKDIQSLFKQWPMSIDGLQLKKGDQFSFLSYHWFINWHIVHVKVVATSYLSVYSSFVLDSVVLARDVCLRTHYLNWSLQNQMYQSCAFLSDSQDLQHAREWVRQVSQFQYFSQFLELNKSY